MTRTTRPRLMPRMRAASVGTALATCLAVPAAMGGQPVLGPAGPRARATANALAGWESATRRAGVDTATGDPTGAPPLGRSGAARSGVTRAPWWAPAASAVVPGAGQALLRQSRGVVYAAVEGYTWLQYRESRRFADRQRDEYRRIAREFARRQFPGARPDGDWDYYERLAKLCVGVLPPNVLCASSGTYDITPGGDVDPETDITTYNGQIWWLARTTYWSDPDVAPPRGSAAYSNALAFYRSRAERPEYQWSWRDQQGSLDVYRTTIAQANGAARDATRDLSIIIANHVLSTVDAFVTVRLRRYGGAGTGGVRGTGFEATVPWAPFGRRSQAP